MIAVTAIFVLPTQYVHGGFSTWEAEMIVRACVRVATETLIVATVVALALPFLFVLTIPFIRM